MPRNYPDLSDIFAAKMRRRLTLADLSWEEKVAIVQKMQRLQPRGVWRTTATQASVNKHASTGNKDFNQSESS